MAIHCIKHKFNIYNASLLYVTMIVQQYQNIIIVKK
jgi:hypothetical protein